LVVALRSLSPTAYSQEKEKEQIKGVLAEPADAADVREQIAVVEKLKTIVPDRARSSIFCPLPNNTWEKRERLLSC